MAQKKIRTETDRQDLLRRIRRVGGQVRAVERMIDDDAYCIDILTQIAAARAALLSVGRLVLQEHMRSCVAESFKAGNAEAAIAEIDTVLAQFIK